MAMAMLLFGFDMLGLEYNSFGQTVYEYLAMLLMLASTRTSTLVVEELDPRTRRSLLAVSAYSH